MDSLLRKAILEVMPADGSGIGSQKLAEAVTARMTGYGKTATPADVQRVKEALIAEGLLDKGSGRGGSVYLARPNDDGGSLVLTTPPQPGELALSARPAGAKPRPGVPRQRVADGDAAEILSYRHPDKRKNNPEVGMVRPENDPSEPDNRWCYDPHIDPALQFDFGRAGVEKLIDDALASGGESAMRVALEELKRYSAPYLNWTGKAERTSFEVDTISLHVHERIDPASILSAVRKRLGERRSPDAGAQRRNSGGTPPDSATLHPGYAYQPDLFAAPFENLPLRDAIDFYKHERGWANRLIAGDSLLVMNSLLQKESLAGQVQMIYIDPPYGIKYGSNFQPFVNKRDVKDRKDEDLTSEPEMIKAFRDTWELGIHSYLTYLRDRLLLAKELLHESGSVFVQISDENLHLVRNLIDEIFEADNFCGQISFRTTGGQSSALLSGSVDYLLWYAKDKASAQRKYHVLTKPKAIGNEGSAQYVLVEPRDVVCDPRRMTDKEMENIETTSASFKILAHDTLFSQGSPSNPEDEFFNWRSVRHRCPTNTHWKPGAKGNGMLRLDWAGRLMLVGNTLRYKRYYEDYPVAEIDNVWNDTAISGFGRKKQYVVETSEKVIERCLLMTTDPGDLVLDPTCGSGTTAFVAEKWGRRWITCDTSRVSVSPASKGCAR